MKAFGLSTAAFSVLCASCVVVSNPPHNPPPPSNTQPAPAASPPAAQPKYEEPPPPPDQPAEQARSIAEGRPPGLKSGSVEAYWIWHDSAGWHLRTTTHSSRHRFQGRVSAMRGSVDNVRATRLEYGDRFRQKGNQMAFDFTTDGGVDGFDFAIAEGDCAQFYLLIDGKPNPERVVIGAGGRHPSHTAFRLCK
jgi:hypothetical protein